MSKTNHGLYYKQTNKSVHSTFVLILICSVLVQMESKDAEMMQYNNACWAWHLRI